MRSYLSLVPILAKVRKRQSRMTRICIILAVFLVTAIFSMVDMWIRMEKTQLISRHGNYHIILQNIPEDEAEQIRKQSSIAVSSWYSEINPNADKDYYVNGKKTVLYGTEASYITKIRNYPLEGSCPQDENEILLSANAKELFGIHVGDRIALNTPSGDLSYTVSGFCEDDEEFNDIIDGVCTYMNMAAFQKVSSLNGESSSSAYYIQFQDHINLKKTIADMKEQYSLADQNIAENTIILGLAGASTNENVSGFYPLAGISFLLILISGVLMISSCINSNIAQRTKFFGMMRCIGASKQQIIRFIRLEALSWCKTAIPAGCVLGIVTNWLLCAILRLLIKGEFADIPLFEISPVGIFCGAAVGIITVFIAAHSPARCAARVSPVSAVSGIDETGKNVRHAANTRFFRVETALGIHHAVSAKKNLILMTGSFAFTIILFFVFWVCLDFVRSLIPSLNSFTPDVAIVSQDNTNAIDRGLLEEISEIPGVECAFGNMFALETPVRINGSDGSIDLISYDEYMLNWSKKSVINGDLSKVFGDSDYALTIFNKDSRLNVGDKIEMGDQELEIACVVSEGIWGDARATVVCSEETFTRLTGEQNFVLLNAKFGKDATDATVDAIRNLAGENSFTDHREGNTNNYKSYWVFRLAAYGFLAILSLITVLNIMNSISMSVSARIKQYGAMRAVGMESRQITRMITAEALTYAVCGSIIGGIFGLLLNYLLYERLIVAYFGGTWKIPVTPVAVILLIISVSCAAAVHAPAQRIRNMAITDTINEL